MQEEFQAALMEAIRKAHMAADSMANKDIDKCGVRLCQVQDELNKANNFYSNLKVHNSLTNAGFEKQS